jgi:hypothetical protein
MEILPEFPRQIRSGSGMPLAKRCSKITLLPRTPPLLRSLRRLRTKKLKLKNLLLDRLQPLCLRKNGTRLRTKTTMRRISESRKQNLDVERKKLMSTIPDVEVLLAAVVPLLALLVLIGDDRGLMQRPNGETEDDMATHLPKAADGNSLCWSHSKSISPSSCLSLRKRGIGPTASLSVRCLMRSAGSLALIPILLPEVGVSRLAGKARVPIRHLKELAKAILLEAPGRIRGGRREEHGLVLCLGRVFIYLFSRSRIYRK